MVIFSFLLVWLCDAFSHRGRYIGSLKKDIKPLARADANGKKVA